MPPPPPPPPTTGLCVTSNLSNNSPTLRLEQCRKAEPSTFNPSEGILWSNKMCVEAPDAVGQKVKLGVDTKCSKLGQTSATHMHLSFKTTSNGSLLCLDVDERDNSIVANPCKCLTMDASWPGLQSKKLLFHPTTGLCVTSNLSNNSPTLRLEQCRKAEPSTFNPSEGILWSNKLCVEAPNAVGQKVKLGAGTKCSKLGQTSATHMHLSFKTTSNDSFLCFDVDERDNSIVANPCKCLTMDASCDPASQWFKVL
uniref:Uncharacterized protein n=1 Tax=Brassica oleracea var. oleracea TaxID=109376 RepID=A0A0D3EEZ2_BRAOL